MELFQSLCQEYGPLLFKENDGSDCLVVGEKFAEGVQANIYEAKCEDGNEKYVVNIFKEGSPLLDLHKQ